MIAPLRVGVVVFVGAVFGIERRLDRRKAGAEAAQHVLDHVVAAHAQPVTGDLHVDVAIADVPGETRQLVSIGGGNLDERLRPPGNAHDRAVLEHEAVAVAQRSGMRQVEQESRTALAGQHDTAAMALLRIEDDAIDRAGVVPLAGGFDCIGAIHRRDISAAPIHEVGQESQRAARGWTLPWKPLWCRRGGDFASMTIKGKAYIAGAFEHPTRHAPGKTVAQLHAEVALGALADAGLARADVDGYFCSGDAPGPGPASMAEYMNLKLRHAESTELGGASYIALASHAAEAIAAGKCDVALVTLAGRPRSEGMATGTAPRPRDPNQPEAGFEGPYAITTANAYAMGAMRHMYEYGTTSEQLAWVKVAASHHAQYNPHAMLPEVVTVEDVVNSPMIASPLHRLDCCVISDGGGALVIVRPEIAKKLKRPLVKIIGAGEAVKHLAGGTYDLTTSGAARSGPIAFAEAGVTPADIKYASIYDSFTITVIIQLEDLGFCAKGAGGKFVADGNLISGTGKLPFNTDGGGLCNNHPANRGSMTKVIEAVRQLRGEAHPAVQVKNCDLALAHGTGFLLATRHGAGTLIVERE